MNMNSLFYLSLSRMWENLEIFLGLNFLIYKINVIRQKICNTYNCNIIQIYTEISQDCLMEYAIKSGYYMGLMGG